MAGGLAHSRVASVRERLGSERAEAFVSRAPANVRWLTAFDGVWDDEPAALALVTADKSVVLTDSRYLEAASEAAQGGPWTVELCTGDLWMRAFELAGSTMSVESSMPFEIVERVRDAYSGGLTTANGWIERLRTVKDDTEIARIRAAQDVTDEAFRHVLGALVPGLTESEVALELEVHMRRNGSEGVAFPPIVASGPNAALPHAHPGARRLEPGDFVKLDFGARVDGYCADMTRTVVLGRASDRQREIYDAVLSANMAGIEACRAGLSGADVDRAARSVIEERGYGERFGHGLGHGVGLEVHEEPSVSARTIEPLPAGSVVTIEPGVYLPGFGGVRIEDLVVVREGGCEVLTRSTKDLIEL